MKSIIILFLVIFSYASDINTTIADANISFYNKLLNKLPKDILDDEVNLQKTLLVKLKNFTPKYETISFKVASSQKDFKTLYNRYVDTLFLQVKLKRDIKDLSQKIKTLSTQIKDNNTSDLTKQLFYALYKKKIDKNSLKLKSIDKSLNSINQIFLHSIQKINIDDTNLSKNINDFNKKIKSINQKLQSLNIKKERYQLLNKEKEITYIDKKINTLQTAKEDLVKDKSYLLFLKYSLALQKKDKKAFSLHKKFIDFIEDSISDDESIISNIENLMDFLEKKTFGTVKTIQEKSVNELKNQVKNIWILVNKPLFNINKTAITLFNLSISLFIFFIGFLIGRVYKRYIKKLTEKNTNITLSTYTLLSNLGYYLIFLITLFSVLKYLGIDLSSIALVAGALSVGIGFGLQNIISNFVSGIILMVERSVKIGDYIELDENLRGNVVDIRMRSITINTNSNIDVIVPNQELIQNRVINWTMNDKIRRFEIPFGVAYGTNPQKVIDVVLEAVKNSGFKDIYNTKTNFTRVIMTQMGDSSVNFELFVWIRGKEILYPKRTTSRFLILIYNALYENNIEIPFPQQDLHIKSVQNALPIKIVKDEK